MLKGIDVATYQKEVDWQKVRSDGISFVLIKATQGRSEYTPGLRMFEDSMFQKHMQGAISWGMRVGVYHYLTAMTVDEARAEAKFFVRSIESYRKDIKLYAAVDVESPQYIPDKRTYTAAVNEFCRVVKECGYEPAIYTGSWYSRTYLDMKQIKHPLWLALWRANPPTEKEYPRIAIWQSGKAYVKGIPGKVDIDYMIVDELSKPNPDPLKDSPAYVKGQMYTIKRGDVYTTGTHVPERLIGRQYRIMRVKPGAILLAGIFSWVKT